MKRTIRQRSIRRTLGLAATALGLLAAGASSFTVARERIREPAPLARELVVFRTHGARDWRAASLDGYWSPWRARAASAYASVDPFEPREPESGEPAGVLADERVANDERTAVGSDRGTTGAIGTTGYVDRGLASSR